MNLRSLSMLAVLSVSSVYANPVPAEEWGDDYATGTKLYNQGRLAEAYDHFDRSVERTQNAQKSEAYLLKIRKDIIADVNRKRDLQKVLSGGAESPDQGALSIAYIQKDHIRLTLRTRYLFSENGATLKEPSMEVLGRVVEIFRNNTSSRIEISVIDELEDCVDAEDVHAQRSLAVFALLNFLRKT